MAVNCPQGESWFGSAGRRMLGVAAIAAAFVPALGCAKAEPAQRAAQPPVVEVTRVIQQDVPITKEWVGTLDGYVNAEIRPQVEGYVLRRVYREGSFVKKGARLFEIDPRQFQAALDQAKGELARNEAALERAKLDVARFTPLAAEKAVSQEELDNALSAQRQAQANVESARATVERAQLNVGWTDIASPIDGIAGIAKAQVGDLVNGQSVMTTVSTVDPIKATFSPSEEEYMSWLQRMEVLAPVAGKAEPSGATGGPFELILADGSVYPTRGRLVLTDRGVDVKTGTITVAAAFSNPTQALRPGQFARVRAVVETRKGALLVPQRAVSELQGVRQVTVIGADDRAEVRPVRTGDRVGSLWVIESGVAAGESVVVEGLQKVRPGLLVVPKPAPMPPQRVAVNTIGAPAERAVRANN